MPEQVTQPSRSPRRFLIWVCIFAFLLRVAVIFAAGSGRLTDASDDYFGFGWEMGRVALSLVQGHGFSSPLPLPTGPTAMVGPVYPLLIAAAFKIFGTYSIPAAIAIRILQSCFATLTCFLLYLCGRDTVGDFAGRLAAIAWAIFPLNIFFTVNRIWETSLTGLLAVLLFWGLLKARNTASFSSWILAGALLGFAALVNTSLVVLAIPFGFSCLGRHRLRTVLPIAAGIISCAIVVSPWIARNYIRFAKPMLRSNFALEFRVGNNTLSYGQKVEALHPSNVPAINRHWQQIGEMRFMEEKRAENSEFLHQHFGDFLFDTCNRMVNYWTGAWIRTVPDSPNLWSVIVPTSLLTFFGFLGVWQMLRDRLAAASIFAGCLGVYPIVYYLTTAQPRFYHTVTPFLILSASYWVAHRFSRNAVPASEAPNAPGPRKDLAGSLAARMTAPKPGRNVKNPYRSRSAQESA
ncbi:MAG: glycosyltransferase family 39 protein [Terracidiphilus sp.]